MLQGDIGVTEVVFGKESKQKMKPRGQGKGRSVRKERSNRRGYKGRSASCGFVTGKARGLMRPHNNLTPVLQHRLNSISIHPDCHFRNLSQRKHHGFEQGHIQFGQLLYIHGYWEEDASTGESTSSMRLSGIDICWKRNWNSLRVCSYGWT